MNLGKGAYNLGNSEFALIAPCAPGGLIGLRYAFGHLHSDPVQEPRIIAKRLETVTGECTNETGV